MLSQIYQLLVESLGGTVEFFFQERLSCPVLFAEVVQLSELTVELLEDWTAI